MKAREVAAPSGPPGIGLVTLAGGAMAGGAVAFSVATSGQAAAMPEELTRLVWYAIRVTGVAAFVTLWLTTIAGICISGQLGGKWVSGVMYPLHQLGDLAISLMVLHAALLLGDHYAQFTPASLVIPFAAIYRPAWTGLGIIALYLAAIVFWSIHWRPRIGYRAWRTIHMLSFTAFFFALTHGFASGTDSGALGLQAMYVGTGITTLALVGLRLGRRTRVKPKVEAVMTPAEAAD